MFTDFDFYTTEYGGSLSSEDFKSLNVQASGILRYYTFNAFEDFIEIPQYVKFAICELVDLLNEESKQSKAIVSEKVGSYTRTFANGQTGVQTYAQKQKFIIHKWVPNEYLYRGVQRKRVLNGVWKSVHK